MIFMPDNSLYEIEMKSILSKEKYEQLAKELPSKMKVINEEKIHTTKYTPGDIRLRYSDKMFEIVCKEGDATKVCRKEIRLPLHTKEQLDKFGEMLTLMNFKPDPSWTKNKIEFEYFLNGFPYVICLQNIENFQYILEVEHMSEKDDSEIHKPNLVKIIKELGCEPIEPKEFSKRIAKYIQENKF